MHRTVIYFLLPLLLISCATTKDRGRPGQHAKTAGISEAERVDASVEELVYDIPQNYESVYTNAVKLARIWASAELDNSIGPGPFDAEFAIGEDDKHYYAPNLSDCSHVIKILAAEWQERNNLKLLKSKLNPGEALLHLFSESLEGFFEIRYRLMSDKKKAKVSFKFFGKNATSKSAVFSDIDGIEEFVKLLDKGLSCSVQ